jgi:hypothetical protein
VPPVPESYLAAISEGITSLYRVAFPFTPAGEEFEKLIPLWAEDTWAKLHKRQPTRKNVRAAFRELRTTATQWPVPAQFIAAYDRVTPRTLAASYHAIDGPRALPKPRFLSEPTTEEIRTLCKKLGTDLMMRMEEKK